MVHREDLQETRQLPVQLLLVTAAKACDGAMVLRGHADGDHCRWCEHSALARALPFLTTGHKLVV